MMRMKKIVCLILSLIFLCSVAHASDLSQNDLYSFVQLNGFRFVLPQGFVYSKSVDGVEMFSNIEGEVVGVLSYYDKTDFGTNTTEEILNEIDKLGSESYGTDWAGMLYGEKSGGCYKVGSIMFGDINFMILGMSESGFVAILIGNLNLSNGYDLPHGIFKTLSAVE